MSYTAEEQDQLKQLGFAQLCDVTMPLLMSVRPQRTMHLEHSCGTPVQLRRHSNEKEIVKPVHFCPHCNIEIIGASPDLIWKETNVQIA